MRLLSVIVGCLTVFLMSSIALADVSVGESPEARVTTLDGKSLELKSLRGKVVLVDFWATWCSPCRKALPVYAQLVGDFQGQFVVVAVSIDGEKTVVRDFLSAKLPAMDAQANFLIGWSEDHRLASQFGPTVFPTGYLIDPSGVVRKVYTNFNDSSKARMTEDINRLLAPTPGK